jgi:hypothetical protein
MTQILRLCADYIDRLAVLDPVHASLLGIGAEGGLVTDYSPDGYAARADLIRTTLAELGRLPVTPQVDRRAADHLRERLQAEQAWHASGEPLRLLRAPYGLVTRLRDSVELLLSAYTLICRFAYGLTCRSARASCWIGSS